MENITDPRAFIRLIETSNVPVFADFWAPWGATPCKLVEPFVEQLAKDMEGKILVVRINIDEVADLETVFGIKGIPSFLLFHKGKILWRRTGVLSYEAIKREVERNLPD